MDPPFWTLGGNSSAGCRHVPTMNFKHPEIQNMAQIRNANIGVRKARRASVENPKIYPEKNFEISWKKIKKTLAKFDKMIYTKKACLRR